jgi:Fe-S-cluster formation regulator IscX/YfhJ
MNMPMFTIQCRFSAREETRRDFWQWMEKYTLLVNELLEKIAEHPQFQEWQRKGDISRKAVREILNTLEKNPCYEGLPRRFYTSAELISCQTYKSWLGLQQQRHFQLIGKKRWLQAVESEVELSQITDFKPDEVCAKAGKIREEALQSLNRQGSKHKSLMGVLLDMHGNTAQAPLNRRAINHLLINELQVTDKEQNLDELSKRLDKKRVEIRRLEEQLTSRVPKGRDPTGQRYLQMLCHITALPELSDDPEKLQAELDRGIQQQQLPLGQELPYPIRFDSSSDLYWLLQSQDTSNPSETDNQIHQESPKSEKPQKKHRQQSKERIHVQFKGAKEHTFKIQCDRRQLPVFRQFLIDYQTYKQLPEAERFSEGLFALRSAQLIWRKDDTRHGSNNNKAINKQEDRLKPWNTHRLYLHCTVGRPLLTAPGTERVREEKKKEVIKELKGKEQLGHKDKWQSPTTLAANL